MEPYRFDSEPALGAGPQESLAPVPTPAPRRRSRRWLRTTALGLALLSSAAGGGMTGAAVTYHWLNTGRATTLQAQPSATGTTPQTVSAVTAPAATVAGQVYAAVHEAVVQIQALGETPLGMQAYGSGSGVVVDARGLILTNYHVVAEARGISVRFSNGQQREAQLLGYDRGNDLALLRVAPPEGVPVARLGDSDQVQVGETAIAIGSPFGLENSVTQGIISAVKRDWVPEDGRVRRNLIQTDAPINPGNSGGPLLNARGEVIGINTMIESPVRGSVGVGFAIPINTAKRLLPQLEAGARLEPVWLGIAGQPLDATIARDQGLSISEGVLITEVVPGSPAAAAGLRGGQGQNERVPRGGDVITAVNGMPVRNLSELADALTGHNPGDQITLTIVRDGRQQQVSVTLQAWPQQMG
ncbi:S1C family serine protease [Kallotenue papyrolyticum]|uniref:S1C family serine protease n=1 Tax=Kallotenue papyrolyticum TaxID=1325125 RepID=UPI00047290DD|nr:trypsin-like peptidase domain-containing protein [Kallotenue papyrolyticum]